LHANTSLIATIPG